MAPFTKSPSIPLLMEQNYNQYVLIKVTTRYMVGHGETHHTTAFLVAARNSPWGGPLLVDGILNGLDVAAGTTEAEVVTDVPTTLKWLPGVSYKLSNHHYLLMVS